MKILLTFQAIIALSTITYASAETGSISGSVQLPDRDPIKRMAARYREADARSLGEAPPMIAVVYLRNAETPHMALPAEKPVILAQRGLHFFPRILPITVGSQVAFPNEDDTFHNVFSYSPTKEFDLGRYRKDEVAPVRTFETPGTVNIFCEVHRHMQAYILVLDTPYFVSTDALGQFSITGIPPGKYTATAWISQRKQAKVEVEIEAGANTIVSFE